MEEVKNEILSLTKELRENLSNSEHLEILEKIKEKVKELNNEQVQKKFNGIELFISNEDLTIEENFNKALDYIEYFEKSVEKNYQKDNGEMLPTTEKFKEAIKEKNRVEIVNCAQEFIQYMKTLKNTNKIKMINEKLASIFSVLTKKDINDFSEEEINDLLNQANEVSDIINDKVEIKEDEKKDIPENLAEIRKEMDEILGKSLFEGIENEYEFALSFQLDEYEIDKFQALRAELKELLNDPITNKARIDEIRVEMFIILGIDPYTYKDNKKLIDELVEPNKSRFAELKAKHDELLENKLKKTDKTEGTKKTDDDNKKTGDDNKKPTPTGLVPVPTPEPKKKKGRLVKFAKSAKEFYKKHKKAILLVSGLVLTAIAMQALLPSIMYFNSALWHQAVVNGATHLPTILHEINMIIGGNIGATYASGSGIWTLANGTILNATAAQAGLLASLGKIALSAGTIGIGATVAVKNAYRLAKEKIEKFKNREKKPKVKDDKSKTNLFTNVKDSFTKGYEKGKEKVTEEWNKFKENKKNTEDSKTNKKDPEDIKSENKEFHRSDVSERINRVVNLLIDREYISKKEKEEMEKADKETFMTKFKEVFNKYNIDSVKKDNKEDKVEFNRTDVNYSVSEFIKYCYETGIYTDEDIKKLNEMNQILLRDQIYADPRFVEFEQMRTEWSKDQKEEKGKGL